jgi:glyoxylase-like metal-dependent hydrolase (beta-lactamase superfamily II)
MKIFEGLHGFLWTDPTANNCNAFLIDREKKILVDPGHRHLFSHVREGLSGLGLSPEDIDMVIITHCHPDHMEAVGEFLETRALIAVSESEMKFIQKASSQYGDALGLSDFEPHILLREGVLKAGDAELRIIPSPGHSPGSICLYWPEKKALFPGDVVFDRGIGRTDLPGGNGQQLKESIQRLSLLDVEYLLPGHGGLVAGSEKVNDNFKGVERDWFAYL